MTVLLVNGSPHEHGCTDAALKHAASVLEEQGVHTEIFWIGSKPISGCIGCGACEYICPSGIPLVRSLQEGSGQVLYRRRCE